MIGSVSQNVTGEENLFKIVLNFGRILLSSRSRISSISPSLSLLYHLQKARQVRFTNHNIKKIVELCYHHLFQLS